MNCPKCKGEVYHGGFGKVKDNPTAIDVFICSSCGSTFKENPKKKR